MPISSTSTKLPACQHSFHFGDILISDFNVDLIFKLPMVLINIYVDTSLILIPLSILMDKL